MNLPNKPDCYTQEDWEEYVTLWQASTWFKTDHIDVLMQTICDDCELAYQLSQMALGKCKPVDPSQTPYARVMRGEPETVGIDEAL